MLPICWHPHCDRVMPWGMYLCKRHYALLNDELRRLIRAATDVEKVEGKPLHQQVVAYFLALPKGEHRVFRCKYGCGTDVIWMPRAGSTTPILVDAEQVEARDRCFNRGKHRRHRCGLTSPRDVRGAA